MKINKFIVFLAVPFLLFSPAMAGQKGSKETVVLLHGIAKSNRDMRPIEKYLQKEGYQTLNINYPSKEKNLKNIAEYLHKNHLTKKFWESSSKVHIVTHSMGGLVASTYLDTHKDRIPTNKIGSVIMIAPPNQGSEIADLVHKLPPYEWFYGPAGQELTTSHKNNSAPPYYDLGIIAGTKEWPYFVGAFVTSGESDGRVTVEQTKLEGMKDHVTVNGTHTFIMNKTVVHKQIINFIKNKEFKNDL